MRILLILSFLLSLNSFADSPARFKKVMIVVLENTNYEQALKQTFMSKIAAGGALLKNFTAITHPSQPNYIAMVAGSTHKVITDSNVTRDVKHLGDLLEEKGLNWKTYAEKYPENCYLKKTSGQYARKHVPFLSFKNVQSNPIRCSKIVNASALVADVENETLPEFSMYIPDNNNNGHDTNPGFADKWFAKTFEPLIANPKFMKDMLLVVTFDETESYKGRNHILTAYYGSGVVPGSVSDAAYNHYSTLRTIEDEFQLGTLGLNDSTAEPIKGIWK